MSTLRTHQQKTTNTATFEKRIKQEKQATYPKLKRQQTNFNQTVLFNVSFSTSNNPTKKKTVFTAQEISNQRQLLSQHLHTWSTAAFIQIIKYCADQWCSLIYVSVSQPYVEATIQIIFVTKLGNNIIIYLKAKVINVHSNKYQLNSHYIDLKMHWKKVQQGEPNEENPSTVSSEGDFTHPSNQVASKDKMWACLSVILVAILSICLLSGQWFLTSKQPTPLPHNSLQTPQPQQRKVLNTDSQSKKKAQWKSNLSQQMIHFYRQKTKNLSAEISVTKLNRAKEFLRNLSEPIDPVYLIEEDKIFQEDYNIYVYQEKPICVVVPTYNNVEDDRYAKNMDSILNQNYKNYRVIVIDDASKDQTSKAIERHVSEHPVYKAGKITIQRNKKRKMALANILDAAHNFCKPEEIFMVVDGDDYLLGKLVFKLFNYGFSDPHTWVVYSNFLSTTDLVGFSRSYPIEVIRDNEFRNVLFVISHLRAFYTKLLLLIDPEDFLDQKGNLFHAANDVSIYMPILEMARHHLLYLREISYFYNSSTGMNNHQQKKQEQINNDIYIRKKPRYFELKELFPPSDTHGELKSNQK